MTNLSEIVQSFSNTSVAVIGDLILDRYTWGSSRRISPEAPVPVVDVDEQSDKLGGAGNAAQAMSALGAEVDIYARTGADEAGRRLEELVHEKEMTYRPLPNDSDLPTTVKTRVIAEGQHLVRIDEEDRSPLPEEALSRESDRLREELSEFDALLLSDYGKGVFSDQTLPFFQNCAEDLGCSVVVDPYTDHFPLYRDVSVMTPNETEFREGMGDRGPRETALDQLVERLFDQQSPKAVLITQGDRGMTLYEGPGDGYQIDTEAREVYDVTGAGDTVSGIVTLGEAVDVDRRETIRLSNTAAGLVVGRMGTAAITADELIEAIEGS